MPLQRDSNKHSPKLDDEMKRETESLVRGAPVEARVEESREKEPAADGEPFAASWTSSRLGPDALSARAEFARFLHPSAFPATRDELIAEARGNNAYDAVVELLHELPDGGRRFATSAEVWDNLPVPPVNDVDPNRVPVEHREPPPADAGGDGEVRGTR